MMRVGRSCFAPRPNSGFSALFPATLLDFSKAHFAWLDRHGSRVGRYLYKRRIHPSLVVIANSSCSGEGKERKRSRESQGSIERTGDAVACKETFCCSTSSVRRNDTSMTYARTPGAPFGHCFPCLHVLGWVRLRDVRFPQQARCAMAMW
eukprot:scaffold285_cov330-Pavlova_lutheri.AAC.80